MSPPLLATLDHFFRSTAPAGPGDLIVVAFSGGPDSTALLAALRRLAPERGWRLLAAHLDHGADPGSRDRAEAARGSAARMGVEWRIERRPVPEEDRRREGLEAAARRTRYRFLEDVRLSRGGRWIATAHHRDDQAETVVLRLLQGTGIEGLGGIRPVRDRVVRPFLALPRRDLDGFLRALDGAGAVLPAAVEDPTNRDLRIARNRVRRSLLPRLEQEAPEAAGRLARLAASARGARDVLEGTLEALLSPEPAPAGAGPWGAPGGLAVRREALECLPGPVLPHALALLHRRAGAPYPAGRAAVEELLRQLADPGALRAGVDCPGGWRWETAGDRVVLGRRRQGPTTPFSYTLTVPGEVAIPEIGIVFRVRSEPAAPWMLRGSRRRAGLALPLRPGDRVEVRNRRPGDRLRPLGAPGTRKLKDVLIDARVPRPDRDRVPLLLVDGRIAWVPGVTVDQSFRLAAGRGEAWTAEMIG